MRLVLGQLLLVILLILSAACTPNQTPAKADFRATDTPARVPAIVSAADSDDAASLPELIHALADKDPAVRLFAIQSLQERTGETMGYQYYEAVEKRQAAIARWHAWLAEQVAPAPITTETTD
ncbi:MAG: HEAT repeat domain-containing protein [Phycisphaeraceae bacterium]